MQIKLDYRLVLHLVMLYPLSLAIISAFGKEPFFITAPYFLVVMMLMIFSLLYKKNFKFRTWELIQLSLTTLLFVLSLINFSFVRYSLPILFIAYIIVLQIFLSTYSIKIKYHNFKYFRHYFIFYILLSLVFVIFQLIKSKGEFRFEGFLGSPTVFSAFIVLFYILALKNFKSFRLKFIWYIIVLGFVLLSKTRLMLLITLVLPILFFSIDFWKLSLKKVLLVITLILLFLYPAYKTVVDYFPNLVTMRYDKDDDKSYQLRYYLYSITQEDFLKQDLVNTFLGQGNEHSRLFVLNELGIDLYPHNDFIRIINDWGILGALLFFILIYRYGIKTKISLMVAILYLIQFYSNLIFNLFFISVLIIVSTLYTSNTEKNK